MPTLAQSVRCIRQRRAKSAYFLEQMNERPVDEVPQEEFVTTGDRCSQVTEGKSGRVVLSVSPAVSAGDNDGNHVQSECDGKVLRERKSVIIED